MSYTYGLVGGELVGAFIYTIEATGGKARGFWGASCKACGTFGVTLGMGVVATLRAVITKEALHQWGWRLPFLGSILFGVIGVWLRSQLEDDELTQTPIRIPNADDSKEEALEIKNPLILSESLPQLTSNRLEKGVDDDRTCFAASPVVTIINNYRELLLVIFVTAFWGVSDFIRSLITIVIIMLMKFESYI